VIVDDTNSLEDSAADVNGMAAEAAALAAGVDEPAANAVQPVVQPLPDPPKWYNHCKIGPQSSQRAVNALVNELQTTPDVRDRHIKQLFDKVVKSAAMATKRAEDIKRQFNDLEHIFKDFEGLQFKPTFEWLPKIPPVSQEVFTDMTREIALLKAHRYVESFAVAIEQILVDQDLYAGYEGLDRQEFKNIADDNYSILCEIRTAMSLVFGSVDEHFLTNTGREIMADEFRDIQEMSKRMLRDYLILRQYVQTADYINKLFAYVKQKF
ncbi:unnamed protein product, partial [Medioppia subpectinata]